MIGWILGGGDDKTLNKIEKIGSQLANLLKISTDFMNIESDLAKLSKIKISTNIIVNYGMQEAFELFVQSKQKFIESALTLDIYTTTLQDIIKIIEEKIDAVIDQTSPDIRSNYSSNK